MGTAGAMLKMPFHMAAFPEYATTGFGWPVAPDHLGPLLRELKDRYRGALPPLYITESGASFPEPDHVSGPIADTERISYIASHLGHALDATAPGGIAEDVELLGYYVWTLMDNFEWAAGYSQALRPGPRGFRHAGTHAQGFLLLVPGAQPARKG